MSTNSPLDQKKQVGQQGEAAAVLFFEKTGAVLLARNSRVGRYEIDLIFKTPEGLLFVEVKAQSSPGNPAEAVTNAQFQRLLSAAGVFARRYSSSMESALVLYLHYPRNPNLDLCIPMDP